MQQTIDYLRFLKELVNVGEKKERYAFHLGVLDARTKRMLDDLDYDPNAHKHYTLLGTADERKTQFEAELEAASKHPAVLMPLALNTIMSDIKKRVNEDILLSVHDFSCEGQVLTFRISTSTFAMSFSSEGRASDEARIRTRLDDMRNDGYVIEIKRGNCYCLKDCEQNIRLLKEYLRAEFGATVKGISFYREMIDSVECQILLDKQAMIFKKSKRKRKSVSDVISEDDAIALEKCIDDYIFAIHSFPTMDDQNTMLSLFRSYMYKIECILAYKGDIWKMVESACKRERNANHALWRMKEERGITAIKQIGASYNMCYGDIYMAINYQMKKIGFSIQSLLFDEHESIELKLRPAMLYSEPEFPISLDGVLDLENKRIFKVWDFQENHIKIEEYLKSIFSNVDIEGYFVECGRGERPYINKISIRLSPLDLASLLDSVAGVSKEVMGKAIF